LEKIKAYGICLYKYNDKDSIEVLLCKSAKSTQRWGFLKGVANLNEEPKDTAMREFEEESSIKIDMKYLENLFMQQNELKNIGIYLVNYNNIPDINKFFDNEFLYESNLSSENTEVKFFDIGNLPLIKKKQNRLVQEILNHLRNF